MVHAPRLAVGPPPLADRLVLLVADDLLLLASMQAWLQDNRSGFAVLSTGDSTQALQLIRRHRPDLVVIDLHTLSFLLMEAARLTDEEKGGGRQGASDPRRVEHPGHGLTRVGPGR